MVSYSLTISIIKLLISCMGWTRDENQIFLIRIGSKLLLVQNQDSPWQVELLAHSRSSKSTQQILESSNFGHFRLFHGA
jgi:hypothetical protein